MDNTLNWDEFMRVELRAGTVISAEEFPEARKPAYKVTVDFGPEIGIRKTSAQITDLYKVEELVGKQVLGVVNFPAKQIGPMRSEFLLTGVYGDGNAVILAVPDKPVPNGARLG